MKLQVVLLLPIAACLALQAAAQTLAAEPYSRKNTYSAFFEYSNDSSHIILGATPDRKLATVGIQYERRLASGPYLGLSYMAEFRPFIVSSDPRATFTQTDTSNGVVSPPYQSSGVVLRCVAGTYSYSYTGPFGTQSGVIVTTCSRELTVAQGGSPLGFRIHVMPQRRLQVMLSSNAGYMYSTKPIPVPDAGSFNFTFNFGGGLEYFYEPHRSVRLEYLVQHYSNHYTAADNPGVDSGFVRLSYAFGH